MSFYHKTKGFTINLQHRIGADKDKESWSNWRDALYQEFVVSSPFLLATIGIPPFRRKDWRYNLVFHISPTLLWINNKIGELLLTALTFQAIQQEKHHYKTYKMMYTLRYQSKCYTAFRSCMYLKKMSNILINNQTITWLHLSHYRH